MKTETSKATGRPWDLAPTALHPLGLKGKWAGVYADGRMVAGGLTQADAALIVERVNGWEALEAERDALKANLESVASHRRALLAERDALRDALRALHERCHEYSTIGPGDWAGYDRSPEAKAARAALGKGAGA